MEMSVTINKKYVENFIDLLTREMESHEEVPSISPLEYYAVIRKSLEEKFIALSNFNNSMRMFERSIPSDLTDETYVVRRIEDMLTKKTGLILNKDKPAGELSTLKLNGNFYTVPDSAAISLPSFLESAKEVIPYKNCSLESIYEYTKDTFEAFLLRPNATHAEFKASESKISILPYLNNSTNFFDVERLKELKDMLLVGLDEAIETITLPRTVYMELRDL